jgi:N-dimethylarginine dimethylaminohydrolase
MPYLEQILNVEVQPLSLLQTRYYHLDTCFCPLEGGFLLYYPDAFDNASVAAIESLVPADFRLAVPDDDAVHFACNAINIGRTVILNKMSDSSKQWLAERSFQVVETPTSEFLKAGGSTKCLSLRLS